MLQATSPGLSPLALQEDRDESLGLANLTPVDHANGLREIDAADEEPLVGLGTRRHRLQASAAKQVHPLVTKSRRRVEVTYQLEPRGAQSDLFLELSAGPPLRRLVRIQPSGGELPEGLLDGMAVLLDEDDAPIVVDGQSRDGSAMSNDFPLGANAAGFFDLIDVDPGTGVRRTARRGIVDDPIRSSHSFYRRA